MSSLISTPREFFRRVSLGGVQVKAVLDRVAGMSRTVG